MTIASRFFALCLPLIIATGHATRADSSRRELHKNLKFDLNGDGRVDTISLKIGRFGTHFQLKINGVMVSDRLGYDVKGFYLANINRADRLTEVVVYTPGPSDDDEHLIFWFDGKKIHRLARLSTYITYRGDGTLAVVDSVDFWDKKDEWFLSRHHQLRQRRRSFYPINLKATTTKALPLRSVTGGKIRTIVPSNRVVLFVKSNSATSWYFVRAGAQSGWVSCTNLSAYVKGLPFAD